MSNATLFRPLEEIMDEQLEVYVKAKHELKMPIKMLKFFDCLEKQYIRQKEQKKQSQTDQQVGLSNIQEHIEHRSFCPSYKQLSIEQKRNYLSNIMEDLNRRKNKNDFPKSEDECNRQILCEMRVVNYCIPFWTGIIFKLNKQRKKITIIQQNRVIELHLREYLLRNSKVHSYCMVFENVSLAGAGRYQNYHIKFSESQAFQYAKMTQDINKIIINTQAELLYSQINEDDRLKLALNPQNNKIRVFLSSKNLKVFEKLLKSSGISTQTHSTQLSEKEGQNNQKNQYISESQIFRTVKQDLRTRIQVSSIAQCMYRAKLNVIAPINISLNNFMQIYKANHLMVYRLKTVEQLKMNIPDNYVPLLMAVYQKIIWQEKVYSQLLIAKQQAYSDQSLKPTQDAPILVVSLQNIDHSSNRNFLQNLQMTIKQVEDKRWQVNIFASFSNNKQFGEDAYIRYLQQFRGVFQGINQYDVRQDRQLHDELLTIIHPEPQDRSEQIMLQSREKFFKSSDENKQYQKFNRNTSELNDEHNQDSNRHLHKEGQIFYLKHKYRLNPTQQKVGIIMKDHFLWNNWKRAQNGGLVCRDEQLVQKQKKLYKVVLKKFGETLLTGKNIINFSLPVVVFKKESHLQSLAKSYLYSPLFVQKAALIDNPLQRMKYSILIMMTQNALSIHMQKPFNPILGQTYQGWIDGCPMYLEQISHHPPISAYYFIGRGFKKYGCIEPRISIGLNTGSGYSIFPHIVQFNDGMKIQYICAKIMIGGLLIGERTFNFEDKIYAYDRKHRYFASLSFGPIKKGFFTSSSQPNDYFHGYIYQVTQDFQQYFDNTNPKQHPQERHIIKKLTFFDGIWNSSVNVNGEQVVNFKTDLPYQFVQEDYPLPSDSRYRDDLSNLRKGDLEAAQTSKEEMEELQRHDKKLREEHNS